MVRSRYLRKASRAAGDDLTASFTVCHSLAITSLTCSTPMGCFLCHSSSILSKTLPVIALLMRSKESISSGLYGCAAFFSGFSVMVHYLPVDLFDLLS